MRRLAILLAAALLAAACQTDKSPRQATTTAAPPPAEPSYRTAVAEPVTFAPIGHPDGACMTEDEMAAEQAIRLHTSMMVTGLTCHNFYREPALFDRYQQFTLDHQGRLGAAQDTIGRFLARYRSGNRNRLYDTYQTEVANAESRLVAAATAPTYCRLRRDQYFTATDFTQADFDAFVDLMVDHHRDSYRVCR